jgi:hypothetical protein
MPIAARNCLSRARWWISQASHQYCVTSLPVCAQLPSDHIRRPRASSRRAIARRTPFLIRAPPIEEPLPHQKFSWARTVWWHLLHPWGAAAVLVGEGPSART